MVNIQFNATQLNFCTELMRALAHPLRLRMIDLLQTHQPASVQTIYTEMKIEQSVASQHLRILRDAGLVYTQRRGKFVEYLLNEPLLFRAGTIAAKLVKP
ncbi:MAG: helix-turn-helix transcriptional regulator [Lewinellaceae bacterium]|nr:helix-turn-helix transcriptional regulator [Saprospiraceae bacterium]MCB9331791.1 helix-turn-helix transcriptional regulator [Lewinellaceae bacterium]